MASEKQQLDTTEVLSLMPVIRDVASVVYLFKERMLNMSHPTRVALIQ